MDTQSQERKKSVFEDPDRMSRIPRGPGVYLMKDVSGEIIYVGKARNIKKRMASYFSPRLSRDPKTAALIRKIHDFETLLTETEKEALILESSLIKRHRPRYNVTLKDDKRYPVLRLDMDHPYPDLRIVRKIKNDRAVYFGPFSSSGAVRQTLRLINRTFKLRKCGASAFKNRSRPCLHHQMDACLAPCCLDVKEEDYREIIADVTLFLRGKTPALIRKIHREMFAASDALEFERAAALRDKKIALEKTLERQVSVTVDLVDRDVIAVARENEFSMIAALFVRGGRVIGSRSFPVSQTLASDPEITGAFIRQHYEKNAFIPEEILTEFGPEDKALLEERLSELKNGNRRKKKIRIRTPRRGERASLVKMAAKNAEKDLKDHIASLMSDRDLMSRLKRTLKLKSLPARIECFDNSNMSGKEAVSAMAVFVDGKPDKSRYRKYKIKNVTEHDDYAYMAEVLKRRYGKGEKSKPYPNLLLVDGGKGQLGVALAILRDLGLDGAFDAAGIAKKDPAKGEVRDKIYRPGRANPVQFGGAGDLLLFLQRVRDEAHRFVIAFHRKQRGKNSMRSALDDATGIGEKRKAALMRYYKSVKNIRDADEKEMAALPGMNMPAARAVKETLGKYSRLK
ncbi:UvrABC system protein C [Candidatus Desulfarcum epimagneticum]|uniref:UvrABC system protein C n=1 Tax=uncultured Desulfobacteraceae bacterium TaxID=218296 RepID=A0A484HJG4_9BACT|nr:UvrABC system protein C [uncultured Desulfobacteraceae bacterium]